MRKSTISFLECLKTQIANNAESNGTINDHTDYMGLLDSFLGVIREIDFQFFKELYKIIEDYDLGHLDSEEEVIDDMISMINKNL